MKGTSIIDHKERRQLAEQRHRPRIADRFRHLREAGENLAKNIHQVNNQKAVIS